MQPLVALRTLLMKLADWLFENSKSPEFFRRKLGVPERSTVSRWLTGKRKPNRHWMRAITQLTGGAVQSGDFDDPSPPRCVRPILDARGDERLILPWHPGYQDESTSADGDVFSPPVKRALNVLGKRVKFTPGGTLLLDGRPSDLRRIVQAANEILRRRGQEPIHYPGVEPLL